MRSPALLQNDSTGVPIFLCRVPLKKPRTECPGQSVALMSSFSVTPPGRFSRSRTLADLVPRRAGIGFLWWATFRAGLDLVGEACGPGLAARSLVFALAGAFLVCSFEVGIFSKKESHRNAAAELQASLARVRIRSGRAGDSVTGKMKVCGKG